MTPTEIRDMNWQEICEKLAGPRQRIWEWLVVHGEATTSELSERLGINLLTVRPRVTELVQMGFAECCGREGREGIYKARPFEAAKAVHTAPQGQLNLKL